MTAHKLCPECSRRAGEGFVLTEHGAEVYADIELRRPMPGVRREWQPIDRLVTQTAPEEHASYLLWHVRVHNLVRSESKALCGMKINSIKCPAAAPPPRSRDSPLPEPEAPLPPSWHRFVCGEWRREMPRRPGIYPVRGHVATTHPHMIRAVAAGRVLRFYDEFDQEMDTHAIPQLWVWSEPMPPLPPTPTEEQT